jgi:hypothetical protein
MRKHKAFLALAVLLSVLGIGMANTAPTAAKVVSPTTRVMEAKETTCCDCPPCPLCPSQAAEQSRRVSKDGFTCPLTGEQLPCPNCCPLNAK